MRSEADEILEETKRCDNHLEDKDLDIFGTDKDKVAKDWFNPDEPEQEYVPYVKDSLHGGAICIIEYVREGGDEESSSSDSS